MQSTTNSVSLDTFKKHKLDVLSMGLFLLPPKTPLKL